MGKFKYNQNEKKRNEILEIEVDEDPRYSTFHFEDLTLDKLDELIKKKFVDPDEQQNDAPSIGEFRDWMEQHPTFTAHGYAVCHPREDYRVSIEGVEGYPETREDLMDFVLMFRYADDFVIGMDRCYCWYD